MIGYCRQILCCVLAFCWQVQADTMPLTALVSGERLAVDRVLSDAMSVRHKSIRLRDNCPPSFSQVEGVCQFVSLYQLYSNSYGNGGLRVRLPPIMGAYKPQVIDLGRYLFFDPLLSADRQSSCASCHHPAYGFADALPRSQGFGAAGDGPQRSGGLDLNRAAPSLWNVGFQTKLFWDARASSLQEQAEGPLFNENEMGNTPQALLASLNENDRYRSLFAQAFAGVPEQGVTLDMVTTALAAFQSTLISFNSRYDRYAHGDSEALTEVEQQGHSIFRGFVARCSQCHTPPLFTNNQVAAIGSPEPQERQLDTGVQDITGAAIDRAAFKVPTLRNISTTEPYMHSGVFSSLQEVVEFYNKRRGHAVPEGEQIHIHWHLLEPNLGEQELEALVAFLHTLTDESMMPDIPDVAPSGLPVTVRLNQRSFVNSGEIEQ